MGLAQSGLTVKQDRLADIVASGVDITITEAGKRAGYAHRPDASVTLRLPTVQRAIERKKAERADSARQLRLRGQRRLGPAIDREDDAKSLAIVVKAMADVEATLPQDMEGVGRPEDLVAMIHRAFRCGYAQALRGKQCKLVADMHSSPSLLHSPTSAIVPTYNERVSMDGEVVVDAVSGEELEGAMVAGVGSGPEPG